jgi:hypothetical protein
MGKPIPLLGGSYQARSVVASAQRCLNLYAEPIPEAEGEPARMAHYPTPGSVRLSTIGTGPIRGIRQASNSALYVVSGSGVYSVNPFTGWSGTLLGSITAGLTTPVSMHDNGLELVIVDGSVNGWVINLAANTMSMIVDPGGMFVGADRVDYLDTFFILNKAGSPQFYWSGSLATTFDPLDFANKESASDILRAIAVARREIYLLGVETTEIWYDAGATDIGAGSSQFAAVQGVFIDHGVMAIHSVATYDNTVFWLARNRQGRGVVLTTAGYRTDRISTYAIEEEFRKYGRVDDAIGWTYQISGHTFYVLTFPTADHTWVYDTGTRLWHEWLWIDTNGAEHRHRANCFCAVYGDNLLVGDWQDGSLYLLSNDVYTDAQAATTGPIKRVRSFPHIEADNRRLFFREFVANLATGNAHTPTAGSSNDVSLRWSDDRGASWGSPVTQSIGLNGEYLTNLQWQRLGLSRSRVFEISWSTPMNTALQGCWLTVEAADADEPVQQAAEAAE